MTSALFGFTGFVGGNIARQHDFTHLYNSTNSHEARGSDHDLIVFSAARAEKWKANADPDGDRRHIDTLVELVGSMTARRFVLISTVDVYANPRGVDESATVDASRSAPYGAHRRRLEEATRESFPDALIVRLPGLYGQGLKKNVIFDLLTGNQVEKINPDSAFQFYGLDRLWADIQRAQEAGLSLVNLSTQPVATREIASRLFGVVLEAPAGSAEPVKYDVHTQYASVFGGSAPYLEDRDEVLAGLSRFVAEWV